MYSSPLQLHPGVRHLYSIFRGLKILKLYSGGMEKKDVGRIGNAATHTCSVCAVHLCNGKGRFPGSSMSCFDLWHCVPNLLTDKRTETLCHVRCPAEGKINIIHKLAGNKRAHLCGGVRRQAASKVVKVGKPTYDLRNNY